MGPASAAENVGPIGSVVSGEKSGVWGDSGESASAWKNARESRACSNVANGPTAAELIEFVDAAIIALDAGETGVAMAQLQAFADTVRTLRHGCSEMALTGVRGKKGLDDPAGKSDEEFVREG
jgi:hypothetical protein